MREKFVVEKSAQVYRNLWIMVEKNMKILLECVWGQGTGNRQKLRNLKMIKNFKFIFC